MFQEKESSYSINLRDLSNEIGQKESLLKVIKI